MCVPYLKNTSSKFVVSMLKLQLPSAKCFNKFHTVFLTTIHRLHSCPSGYWCHMDTFFHFLVYTTIGAFFGM